MCRLHRPKIPWQVRDQVLRRANCCCEDCGTTVWLELHHLTYQGNKPGESIFGNETVDDLVALCRNCHQSRHTDINGDFWADPDEMEAYWATFDNNIS